jgi:hypothetical protein
VHAWNHRGAQVALDPVAEVSIKITGRFRSELRHGFVGEHVAAQREGPAVVPAMTRAESFTVAPISIGLV